MQKIEVDQIWRRKKTGKLIRIVRRNSVWDNWFWKGHDYKGQGVSLGAYIRRDYELVSEKGED